MKGKMYVFAIFIVFLYFSISTILVQAGSLDNSYTVILHVHSPIAKGAGVHIFDGSVIEARRISDGKRMGVKTADRNGSVIFKRSPKAPISLDQPRVLRSGSRAP